MLWKFNSSVFCLTGLTLAVSFLLFILFKGLNFNFNTIFPWYLLFFSTSPTLLLSLDDGFFFLIPLPEIPHDFWSTEVSFLDFECSYELKRKRWLSVIFRNPRWSELREMRHCVCPRSISSSSYIFLICHLRLETTHLKA